MKKHAERNGQSPRELSEQQQAAEELLAAGKTDKEAARALNLRSALLRNRSATFASSRS
jgi:hypothetical protein